ncbi:MAG: diacylglycerol kinase family protein [Clostridia bacterium]|nr:diacylglycerol kinase family protein [Clostridia bacterium]
MKLQNEKKRNPFIYALKGWKQALKTEKNLKFDCIVAIIIIVFGFILKISISEWIVCILLIGLVIFAELMNTAIETVVDMYTTEKNKLAGKAKDISAGAVLVTAIIAAIIGCIIFIPKILMYKTLLGL